MHKHQHEIEKSKQEKSKRRKIMDLNQVFGDVKFPINENEYEIFVNEKQGWQKPKVTLQDWDDVKTVVGFNKSDEDLFMDVCDDTVDYPDIRLVIGKEADVIEWHKLLYLMGVNSIKDVLDLKGLPPYDMVMDAIRKGKIKMIHFHVEKTEEINETSENV